MARQIQRQVHQKQHILSMRAYGVIAAVAVVILCFHGMKPTQPDPGPTSAQVQAQVANQERCYDMAEHTPQGLQAGDCGTVAEQ